MSATTLTAALTLGLAAGVVSGLFGVGGGLLFVPALVLLGLGQVEAEATSLAAVLPTVAVGAWRQNAYGNVRWRPAVVIGLVSVVGVQAGALIALALPEVTLRRLFAAFLVLVAGQLLWRARSR